MAINYGVSEKGKAGRRLLAQVMAAREWAEMKTNRRFKREKSDKQPYQPGKSVLGLSAMSESIKGDHFGNILSRRERRQLAKWYGRFIFSPHYNGEGPVRVEHNIKPSKYAGARG